MSFMIVRTPALGDVTSCTQCAHLDDSKLYFRPDLAWISDERLLGPDLRRLLRNSKLAACRFGADAALLRITPRPRGRKFRTAVDEDAMDRRSIPVPT